MGQTITETAGVAHWDDAWRNARLATIDPDAVVAAAGTISKMFYRQIGDVSRLRVLDLGRGAGALSVWLAKRGAQVTALDTSQEAVSATRVLAEHNGVAENIELHHGEMHSLFPVSPFDLIVGIFVLHHLEPFDAACDELNRLLAPSGRGVFLENSSRNPFLMFSRKYLAGRGGIPRYGDQHEYPFEPSEVKLLEKKFGHATAAYPELVFISQLNTYVFRQSKKFRPFLILNGFIDRLLFRLFPFIRKYSYQQIVTFHR